MARPTTPGRGVSIRVTANTAKARQDIAKLDSSFKRVGTTATSSTQKIARLAAGIGAAFGGVALTRAVNRSTDSFVDLENQIALVVGRTEALTKQMDEIYKISLKTKAPVAATAESFSRLGRSLQGSGASIDDINKAVVSLNKAAAISGGSVESQRAALFQLGQGLASGQLRGQELNSVLEQLPRAARAFADELGVSLGQLREIAAEGELTSDVVFKALLNQADQLDKEFSNIELTSGKALVLFGDQVRRLTADISIALGVTDAFTQRIQRATNFIAGNRESIVNSIVQARDRMQEFTSSIREAATLDNALDFLGTTFSRAQSLAVQYLEPVASYIRNWSKRIIDYFFVIYDDVIGNSWWTDTMKETKELADKYLPQVERRLEKFKRFAVDAFENLYRFASNKFQVDLDLRASVQSIAEITKNVKDAAVSGFQRAVKGLTGLEGDIRKIITGSIVTAFVAVFSTGSLFKSFSNLANKLGPVLLLSLSASIVEAVGSPRVFAAFGVMAGELVGTVFRQIGDALPTLVAGFFTGIPSFITGVFKEAGLLGSIAFVTSFGILFKKQIASVFAGLNLARIFTRGLLGQGRGGNKVADVGIVAAGLAPFVQALSGEKTTQKVLELGKALRGTLYSAILSVGLAAKSTLLPVMTSLFATLKAGGIPTVTRLSGRLRGLSKQFRTVAASAAALALVAAGSASASTGADGGAASGFDPASVALIVGAILGGPVIEAVIERAGGPLGRKLGESVIGSFLKRIPSLFGGVAARLGSLLALALNPVTLGIAAVAGATGLVALYLFGEGGTFTQELARRFRQVSGFFEGIRRRFGATDIANAENGFATRRSASRLAASGRLGRNRFENARNREAVDNINFSALSETQAGRITDAVKELEDAESQFHQETLRYGQASLSAQNRLEKAQKETTEALKNAPNRQAQEEQFQDAVQTLQDSNGELFQGIRSFFSEAVNQRVQDRNNIVETASLSNAQDTIAAYLSSLSESEKRQLGDEIYGTLFEFANSTQEFNKEVFDAYINLFQEVSKTESGIGKLARGLSLNKLNASEFGAVQEALDNLNTALDGLDDDFNPRVRDVFTKLRENLETLGQTDLEPLFSLAGAEGVNSRVDTRNDLVSRRQELLDGRVGGVNTPEVEEELLRLEDQIIRIENDIKDAIRIGTEGGLAQARYEIISDSIESEISRMNLASLINDNSDGIVDFFDFEQAADRIRAYREEADEILRSPLSGTPAYVERVQQIEDEIAELQKQIQSAVSLGDAELLAIDVEEANLTRDKLIEIITSAATLSDITVDPDKLMSAPDSLLTNLAKIASGFLTAATARNALNAGVQDPTANIEDITSKIKANSAALKDAISTGGFSAGSGGGGGGSTETPIEKILQRTGVTLEGLIGLTAGDTNSLYAALQKIEEAEKAINKSGLDNVALREKQLEIIRQQNQAIDNILLSGNVATAEAAGVDGGILSAGPEAVAIYQRIRDLEQERSLTNASNFETIRAINSEIETQQNLLDRMVEGGNPLFDSFRDGLKSSLSELFRSGDFKGAFMAFADQFTTTVIDTFVGALVDSLINEKALKNMFDGLFDGDFFKKISDGIGRVFSSLQGGSAATGSAGGGFFGTLVKGIGSIFGFMDRGGTVPMIPGAQVGKDSVPMMLKPGEIVTTSQDARNQSRQRGDTTATFNLNITGDVSRQTRRQIVEMIPEITGGVNQQNRENGFFMQQ